MAKGKKRRTSDKASRKGRGRAQQPPKTSFWDALDPKYRHLIAFGVLLALALAFFAPVNFQGMRLTGSDAVQAGAMGQSMKEFTAETGEVGLWSPNLFSGMPGYFIGYDPVVIQADVIVRALAKVAYPTFQFLLLVVGMYTLITILTKRSLAALIAAAAFGFTTYVPIILEAGHNTKFIALSWVPWIVIAFIYVLRRPGAVTGLVFAAALALGLRAGHAQITYNMFFLLGIWWVVEAVAAVREKRAASFATSTALLIAGTGVALLMVAQPYWSQLEYKQFSMRGGGLVPVEGGRDVTSGGGLNFDYAMAWSQGWFELLTYLIAGALGGGSETYWGEKVFTSGPHYVGGVVLALSIVALIGKRSRTTTAVGISVFVITLFALGKNASLINRPLFDFFPFFDAFRAPEIWLHMVEFGLAVLAGLGATWLVDSVKNDFRSKVVWGSFGGLFGVTLILLLTAPSMVSFEKANEREQLAYQAALQNRTTPANPQIVAAVDQYMSRVKEERAELFRRDAVRSSIFLALALIGIFLFLRTRISGATLLVLLGLLVLVDLWGVGKRHLTADSYSEGGVVASIPEFDFDRFIKVRVDEAGGPGHFRTLSLERSPTDWARPAFHYEVAGGYHAAKLRVYQDLINHLGLGGAGQPPSETMLDLTGTRFVVGRNPVPGSRPVFNSEVGGLVVFERPRARWENRTGLVGRAIVVENEVAVLDQLKRPAFDRNGAAILLQDPGQLGPIDSLSIAGVQLNSYDAHHAEWSVATDKRRLLVTSEIFYPAGWTATIDGEPAEILQANHAFRAIVVPEGEHVVRMSFYPESHHMGALISLLATLFVYGCLLVLGGLAVVRSRSRRAGPQGGE